MPDPGRLALGVVLGVLSAATTAVAQTPAPPDALGTVSTQVTATRRLPNTAADVSVAVVVHGRLLPEVSADMAKRAGNLLAYLQAQRAGRLRTGDVSLQPDTESVTGKPDRITGYTGHTTVSFRVTPDVMPAVLAGCLDHGADSLDTVAFTPTEEELEAARRELATEATRTAVAQATAVAEAAGEHVVRLQSVNVGAPNGYAPPAPRFAVSLRAAAAPAVAVPALPGDAAISVTVAVQVRIDR